jgi:galactokinase
MYAFLRICAILEAISALLFGSVLTTLGSAVFRPLPPDIVAASSSMDVAPAQHDRQHPVLRAGVLTTAGEAFRTAFGHPPDILAIAPGRVNLIGDHTDYNDGCVLPAAIDRYVAVAASPGTDGLLVVHSVAHASLLRFSMDRLHPSTADPWSNYVQGVAAHLQRNGVKLQGASLSIAGTVPPGAGLSSSAALELATCSALITLAGGTLDLLAQARLCRDAEHEFAGVQCGIMDQFASALGRRGHALLLDCRSLTSEYIPFPAGAALVVCHSGVDRALAGSAYNLRREECRLGVGLLRQAIPSLKSLRDVTPEQFAEHAHLLSPPIRQRCRHVITENARVLESAAALRQNDLPVFGKLMYQSHLSLRNDYEVSCSELDTIVNICAEADGVYGARLTGAGFGGCAVCLVDASAADELMERLLREYSAGTSRIPLILRCLTEDGVSVSLP